MFTILRRWLRPMLFDIKRWWAGNDPVALHDAVIWERRETLIGLEAAVEGIVQMRNEVRSRANAGIPGAAEELIDIEANLVEAEQGLAGYRAEVDKLVAQRSALAAAKP